MTVDMYEGTSSLIEENEFIERFNAMLPKLSHDPNQSTFIAGPPLAGGVIVPFV